MSIISLALKVFKACLYPRRFEFHIESVVIEYPSYQSNIIHCPCRTSDSLSQKENDFQSRFYMYWFTDLWDTSVVMWFLFKLVIQFLSQPAGCGSHCQHLPEGVASQNAWAVCLNSLTLGDLSYTGPEGVDADWGRSGGSLAWRHLCHHILESLWGRRVTVGMIFKCWSFST